MWIAIAKCLLLECSPSITLSLEEYLSLVVMCVFLSSHMLWKIVQLSFHSILFVFGTEKKLEPINTLAFSVWGVFGFYWIGVGDQALLEDSPRLYW